MASFLSSEDCLTTFMYGVVKLDSLLIDCFAKGFASLRCDLNFSARMDVGVFFTFSSDLAFVNFPIVELCFADDSFFSELCIDDSPSSD